MLLSPLSFSKRGDGGEFIFVVFTHPLFCFPLSNQVRERDNGFIYVTIAPLFEKERGWG